MKKYEVWATVYSTILKAQVRVCVGEFSNYINASIFAKAYNNHYSSDATILTFKCEEGGV